MIVLKVMDLDLTLRVKRPTELIDKSTSNDKREMERWEHSNHMCLMIMKYAILDSF